MEEFQGGTVEAAFVARKVGADNTGIADYVVPPLTTIQMSQERFGRDRRPCTVPKPETVTWLRVIRPRSPRSRSYDT